MGALEYVPAVDYAEAADTAIDIQALVDLASRIGVFDFDEICAEVRPLLNQP